ncbi:hypothetical protein QBC47DRAFT_391606 [Echria macrotheca]|uniref:Thioredoxin domain-containing protein n=1 Tax=Echria macrotheca TaxID=438768 RepID=A0AAJ0B4B1_9PEZI|nr:hypothetical protein QBC47DRAFT_391606 [Echria macrotheca]
MGLTKILPSSLPASPSDLRSRLSNPGASTYIFFIVDDDPATGKPWCPDVRAALPVVTKFFEGHPELDVSVVSVGSRAEWRDQNNVWRTKWGIHAVPTLVRYTLVADGKGDDGISQAQLVEEDAAREDKLAAFVKGA